MLLNKYVIAGMLCALPLIGSANSAANAYSPQGLACLEEYDLGNFSIAYQQCRPLAEKEDPLAQYVVAMLYKRGKGVKQSQAQALNWLTRSADGGYAASQLRLGKILSAGMQTGTDYTKAVYYFSRAAHQNDKEAQFLLALCFQNGIGVTQNSQTALMWYNRAIEQGLEAPSLTAAALTNTSKHQAKIITKNPDNFAWLKMAAENGDKDAQFEVAMHYINGQDTTQDDAQAIEWLTKSAALSNPKAMSYLAWMSMLGLGMPQNMSQAVKWFVNAHQPEEQEESLFSVNSSSTQLEAQTRVNTQFEKANALLTHSDDTASIEQGLDLLKQAAQSNHPQAQAKLAHLYQTGKWLKQSKENAAKWYERAAKNGNSDAQYALGWIYFNGEGVHKNVAQSYYWFNQASTYGGNRAKSAKQFVRSQMNAHDLALADKATGKVATK